MDVESTLRTRLLIVEAIPSIRTRLHEHVRDPQYVPNIVDDPGLSLCHLCDAPGYDAALLDMDLPDRTGYWLLNEARRRDVECPFVLILDQEHLDDWPRAFADGIDDYVVKPFSVEEVETRIKAVLTSSLRVPSPPTDASTVEDLIVNVTSQTCIWKDTRIPQTPREFDVLACFVKKEGETLTRDQLRNSVRDGCENLRARTIDRHVAKIRAKFADLPEAPPYLHTVYGKGYEFRDPKSTAPSLYFG